MEGSRNRLYNRKGKLVLEHQKDGPWMGIGNIQPPSHSNNR